MEADRCEHCGGRLTAWRGGQMTAAGYMSWTFRRRDCLGCGWYQTRAKADPHREAEDRAARLDDEPCDWHGAIDNL